MEGVRKGGDPEVCVLRKKYSSPGGKAAIWQQQILPGDPAESVFIKSFEDFINQSSFLKNLGKMQHVQERPKETRKGD